VFTPVEYVAFDAADRQDGGRARPQPELDVVNDDPDTGVRIVPCGDGMLDSCGQHPADRRYLPSEVRGGLSAHVVTVPPAEARTLVAGTALADPTRGLGYESRWRASSAWSASRSAVS